MYEAFYGLRERPFELTPNPRFLLMTPRHREALTTLEYGLTARTGIALLVGEAGTGKTTIVHAALQSQQRAPEPGGVSQQPGADARGVRRVPRRRLRPDGRGRDVEDALPVGADRRARRPARVRRRCPRSSSTRRSACPTSCSKRSGCSRTSSRPPKSCCRSSWPASRRSPHRLNQPSLRQLKQRIGLRCSLAALDAAGNRRLHRRARADRRRRCERRCSPPTRSQTIHERSARHSAHDQRHLRQRAGHRVRARSAAGRSRCRARGLPRFRFRRHAVVPDGTEPS